VLITTTFEIPDFRIVSTQGEVFGLTVRSRNLGSGMVAGVKALVGGELKGMTKLLAQSRNEAMARMVDQARRLGANAVVGMRFDSGALGQWSEVCAYGTAVVVVPLTDAARSQLEAIESAGSAPQQAGYRTSVSEFSSPSD